MNIIPKVLAEMLCPNESVISSHKLYGIIRFIPLRIRDSEYRMDFHIYDVSEMSRLIGLPLGTLFQERPKQGLLNVKLGSSSIAVPLSRSNNAIMEPKPKRDPMENVMMAYLENMAEPTLDVENFIEEEEELAEPIELDQTELPSQPSIELKPLPSGLRYVFLDDNRETPVIISDKLSQEETQKLVTILERHKAA